MESTWSKIKTGFAIALALLVGAYLLLFVIFNYGSRVTVDLVLKKYEQVSVLLVMLASAAFGIAAWKIAWATFRTVRQLRERSRRATTEKLAREMQDIKTKAAMLQKTPSSTAESGPAAGPPSGNVGT